MRSITVVGGNLWAIAARELGDALQASHLAEVNCLFDPMIVGQVTLFIPPPDAANTGGLMGPNVEKPA